MSGALSITGTPVLLTSIAGKSWRTIVDTGFDGDLELPQALFDDCMIEHIGPTLNVLAGGVTIVEELYRVQIIFDGRQRNAEATFVDGEEILLGTGMLMDYHMTIDFPASTIELSRIRSS